MANIWNSNKVIIKANESLSNEIDLRETKSAMLYMPSAWTTANITFQAAEESILKGGTFLDLYDDAGVEVNIAVAASRAIGIDISALKLLAVQWLMLRSGTTSTPVAQTAARTLYLVTKG